MGDGRLTTLYPSYPDSVAIGLGLRLTDSRAEACGSNLCPSLAACPRASRRPQRDDLGGSTGSSGITISSHSVRSTCLKFHTSPQVHLPQATLTVLCSLFSAPWTVRSFPMLSCAMDLASSASVEPRSPARASLPNADIDDLTDFGSVLWDCGDPDDNSCQSSCCAIGKPVSSVTIVSLAPSEKSLISPIRSFFASSNSLISRRSVLRCVDSTSTSSSRYARSNFSTAKDSAILCDAPSTCQSSDFTTSSSSA
mmetsp:Transcript_105625/g.182137  ORF Transcript_105625/g.182137 Transcript_105625/m.182137 type:complete len:253 (-) Transcript_105625:3907-4665(-)